MPQKTKEYYNNLDKRSKEYKDWKKRQEEKSKGLGDTIAKVTKATGIDKAVKFVAGEDCGCSERQEQLNKLFAYDVPECLNESEYTYLKRFFNNIPSTISKDTQQKLLDINNRIFKQQEQLSSCGSCVKKLIKRLEKVLNNY
jgi:hypothetical protein